MGPEHLVLEEMSEDREEKGSLAKESSSVKEMEKKLILKTLDELEGNRTHAAKALGISIRTLRNKLSEYKSHGGFQE